MQIIQLEFDFGKLCTKCKSFVDRSLFKKAKHRSEGLHNWCKPCCKTYEQGRLEQTRIVRREQYARCPEKFSATAKRYRERKKTGQISNIVIPRDLKLEALNEERRKKRLDQIRHWNHNVAAKRRGVPGTYTKQEWDDLCAKAGNRCACCREEKPLTVDHIVPLLETGTNFIDNIQPLCQRCNSKKCAKTIDYRWWQKG